MSESQELSAKVDQLTEQVAALTFAVAQLTEDRSRRSPPASVFSAPPASSFSLVSGTRPASATSGGSNGSYNLLAEEIPKIPDFAVAICASLRASDLSFRDRAIRAWESGWWARFVLEGRINKPRPSRACHIANTVYVILKAPGFDCPLYVQSKSSAQYRTIVGDFTSDTLSHGFASLAEARVYCLGAGVEWPWLGDLRSQVAYHGRPSIGYVWACNTSYEERRGSPSRVASWNDTTRSAAVVIGKRRRGPHWPFHHYDSCRCSWRVKILCSLGKTWKCK